MSTTSLKSTQSEEIYSDSRSSSAECGLVTKQPTCKLNFKMIFMRPMHSSGFQSTPNRIEFSETDSNEVSCRTNRTSSVSDSLNNLMMLLPSNTDHDSSSFFTPMNRTSENIEWDETEWFTEFRTLQSVTDPKDIFTYSKVCFNLHKENSDDKILQLMLLGCSHFCYNMRYGTLQDHKNMCNRVAQANLVASKIKGVEIIVSMMPELSLRIPMTGKNKPGLKRIVLKSGSKILVTADRRYAQRCSKKVIYINFRSQFHLFRPTDTIQIGEVILQVQNVVQITLQCDVLTAGQITSEMPVHLPYICQADMMQVSREELEDMEFCSKEGLKCLLLPIMGNEAYLQSIRENIHDFKEIRLLARVKEDELRCEEHTLWVARNYDGVMLMHQSCLCTQQIFQENTKQFMKMFHGFHKPLILQPNQCHFCEDALKDLPISDPEYCFYYPDKFCLTDLRNTVVTLQMIRQKLEGDTIGSFNRIALAKLDESYVDRSSSGSNTMARTICRISYEFNAKAILLCSASGRMAMKISHFRPNCPVIVLTKNLSVSSYLKLFFNIHFTTFRNLPDSYKLCRADRLLVRLLHGLVYGLRLGFFQHGDQIMFCYKKPADVAYTNAVVPFRVDADTVWKYFEMLRGELE